MKVLVFADMHGNKAALKETYEISLIGEEQLGDRTTYQLELKPKSDKVSAFFVRIEIWIDSELWVPVQQKLVEPTQDHLLIRFSDIELNPKLSRSRFDLKLPDDVRIIGN